MKRRLLALLCALAVLFSLTGCGGDKLPGGEPADSSEPVDSTEPSNSTEPSVSPAEEPPLPAEPVAALTCLDSVAGLEVNSLATLGGGRLLLSCNIGPEFRVILVDAVGDAILGETDTFLYSVLGERLNGEIVTLDPYDWALRFYDEALSLLREVSVSGTDAAVLSTAVFSSRDDCIYCLSGNGVARITLEGGCETFLTFDEDAEAVAFDPEAQLAAYTLRSADDVSEKTVSVYDVKEGRVLFTSPCFSAEDFFFMDGLLLERHSDYSSGLGFSDNVFTVYDTELGGISRILRKTGFGEFFALTTSSCAALTTQNYDWDSSRKPSVDFAIVDLASGQVASPLDMTGAVRACAAVDPDISRFVVALGTEEGSRLYLVDPSRISFAGKLEEDAVPAAPEQQTLGDAFSELREKADAIEAEFPVEILIGDEVMNTRIPDTYYFRSLEDPGQDIAQVKESVSAALDVVRSELSRYPEGFLQKFRSPRGEGGLRLLIVSQINSTSFESFEPAGISYVYGAWFNLAMSSDWVNVNLIHHELWHLIEDRILFDDPGAFELIWSDLNPTDFYYGMNFDSYYENNGAKSFILKADADMTSVCFIDYYSTTSPFEDRATIIETIFRPDNVKWFYPKYDSYYELVCSCPHLKAKLDYMARKVNDTFGTVYWEECFK